MRLIALVEEPEVIRKILEHLGHSTEIPKARPARPPPEQTDLDLWDAEDPPADEPA